MNEKLTYQQYKLVWFTKLKSDCQALFLLSYHLLENFPLKYNQFSLLTICSPNTNFKLYIQKVSYFFNNVRGKLHLAKPNKIFSNHLQNSFISRFII